MASKNLYFNIDYTYRGTNNVPMIINPAKSWDFGTGITDLALLTAKIKELFYLDDIETFTANVGGVMYHGFWGLVIPGGANAAMHKTDRIINVNLPNYLNNLQILNDAGLNTLGRAYDLAPASRLFFNASVKARFKSARLVDSTMLSIDFRSRPFEGSGDWTAWQSVNIGAQSQNVDLEHEVSVSSTYPGKLWYEFRAILVNPEGNFTSVVASFYTTLLAQILTPDSWSNTPVTYYIDREYIVTAEDGGSTQLFSDIDGNNLIALEREYWTSENTYYVYGYHPIQAKWIFLYADNTFPPPIPSSLLTYSSGGVATTYEAARNLFNINVPSSPYFLYNDPTDPNHSNQFYTDTSYNTPAEGWYSIDNPASPGVYSKSIYLLGGYKIQEQI